MVSKNTDHQRWLLLGAALTFFIFAPRGLFVGLVVLALLAVRCPQRLLRRSARVSFVEPLKNAKTTQAAISSDEDCGVTLVLVFEARDPATNVQQLRIRATEDCAWTLEDLGIESSEHSALSPGKLLERLRHAGLSYRLGSSAAGEFVFCLVRLPEQTATANLSFYPIDLQLDAEEAQRYASDLGMLLALRSGSRDLEEINTCESYDSRTGEAQSPPSMLEDVWADLHMRFCPQIPSRVFQHYPLVSGLDKLGHTGMGLSSILPPSQRLRMLLSLVGDDLPGAVGTMGPGLKLDQWRKPKFYNCLLHTCRNFGAGRVARVAAGHPQRDFPKAFSLYFLMQDPRDETFQQLRMKFGRPGSASFRHGLLSGVVDKQLPWFLQHYFGQQIGFYFGFMQHLFSYGFALSVLLAPLLAVYSVDWAKHLVQAVAQEKPVFLLDEMVSEISDASQSRWPLWSLLIGLTTTIWGQCVIESWHRQEKRLARQWGCHPWRRALTRSSFRGKLAVSPVDGRLVLVHRNRQLFQARVIAVNLCFLSIWGLVFAILGAIFLRADQVQVATENYASLGVMFSVASVLMYHLFRLVANALTEAENHRVEASWETSILLKKWALTVIVQCYPLLHLLFIRPYLWPCAYGTPEMRQQMGIEHCEFWDQECCDQELRNGQVVISFANVRGDAVLRHARQFIAGWLVSKIFMHNLLKWIIPRLCGFLCTRGLYPLFAVDFAEDVLTDLALDQEGTRQRMRRSRLRRWLCPKRPRFLLGRSGTNLGDAGPSNLPAELISACECQLDKQEPWEVLDTATDLSVHFLVVSLTTVIYPFAPLLFLAHLLVEFQMDLFQLLDRRQPQPRAGHGLPEAWMAIFQSYVYVGALFNLAIVTFRTSLVFDIFGEGPAVHAAFFSTAMLLMVLVLGIVHLVIPRVPSDVVEHVQREREVEAFFIGQSGRKKRKTLKESERLKTT